MQTEHRGEHLGDEEKAVSGRIVDAGPDHLTVHDIGAAEDVTVRIDDRTRFMWREKGAEGRLTDNGEVRVGYSIARGLHLAFEVLVLDPGDGASLAQNITRH